MANKKEKSVFEIAREMEEQQKNLLEQRKEAERLKEEQERLAYEEQLREEKKELLKLKQGIIDKSDMIYETEEEKKEYTIRQKISDFIYHNKWWMGIAGFFLFMCGFLAWQVITTVHPDMIVLLLVHDDAFHAMCSEQISALFENYIQDENQDGKTVVDVYYIPASDETARRSGQTGESTKLFAEFQTGEAVIVISDSDADEFIVPENNLDDLEPYFSDYQETDGVRFYLSDTDLSDRLDWGDPLDDDIYIGIRKVKETMDSEETMQKVYDTSFPALEKFVQEFGHLKTEENAE